MPAGVLYVVATPIGNLGDLSPRAAEVLRAADAVVAEDTRRTRKLYAHLAAEAPPLLSLPAFGERARLGPILARLRAGQTLALCTDAGTPAVSDPGQKLVEAAWEAGARVVPVPGPSAALAALSASGIPGDRFLVAGFLPRKGGSRAAALAELAATPATLVIFEAGNRVAATLSDLLGALGDRRAALARELTKLHEEVARGRLSDLARRFAGSARGEVTLVVEGAAAEGSAEPAGPPAGPEPLEEELRRRLEAGEPTAGIARAVARQRGLPRREVYALLQRMKGEAGG
ncbi:MAG TPA: 16S rRNA (cytidine(1402)-2'-O)-methyltransferase [Anaeromyxobacteraceae bacterium]|nr:16S rRNA (cytidine(1402)-2'-O)-methyltransferase [Anaeromyxobacteraceae bacterium]